MQIFWLIDEKARIKLIKLQAKLHKDKPTLDMFGWKAPWEMKPPKPKIPVNIDMDEIELEKFMRQKPHPGHPKRPTQ